jgi:hypothetical protein
MKKTMATSRNRKRLKNSAAKRENVYILGEVEDDGTDSPVSYRPKIAAHPSAYTGTPLPVFCLNTGTSFPLVLDLYYYISN